MNRSVKILASGCKLKNLEIIYEDYIPWIVNLDMISLINIKEELIYVGGLTLKVKEFKSLYIKITGSDL